MDLDLLKNAVTEVLGNTPNRPFTCLPMSAILYAILKDNLGIEAKVTTGNLLYNGQHLFKQDFSITEAKDNELQYWTGHAWVEVEGMICDLSFFRTLYSDTFAKPYKRDLIELFGKGRGCLIAPVAGVPFLNYEPLEYLHDDIATGIIKGFETLLNI